MSRGRVETPTTRTIRIDNEVYEWLQSKAVPFKDGPNNVLRRLMEEERQRLARRKSVVMEEKEAS
jgi:predicted CopG family antitoxin